MRQIRDKAPSFGAGPLFNQILPLLMSPTLEDLEHHLLVKDCYAQIEGREIISDLAKAADLATMIATMRPDIDNPDEYVRNTISQAFAVVASALGVPVLLPFLKAVALLMGCATLPYLQELVEVVSHVLTDEQQKV
eukprot:9887468-Ditylum_brightwellii.AAC.3